MNAAHCEPAYEKKDAFSFGRLMPGKGVHPFC